MKKYAISRKLNLLTAVLLGLSAALSPLAAAAAVPDDNGQLELIASKKDEWAMEDSGSTVYRYMISDLDGNSRLEVTRASMDPDTLDTDFHIYEVNEAGSGLSECAVPADSPLPDIIVDSVGVFHDEENDLYHYLFTDYARTGEGRQTDSLYSLTLENGTVSTRLLCSMTAAYNEAGDTTEISYQDDQGNTITEEEYNSLISSYTSSLIAGYLELNWFGYDDLNSSDTAVITQVLRDAVSQGEGDTVSGTLGLEFWTTYFTEVDDQSNVMLVSAVYENIRTDEETARIYPALTKSLQEFCAAECGTTESISGIRKKAEETFKESPDSFLSYQDNVYYNVRRADTRVLSILEERTSYSGGDHGDQVWKSINLDPATGAEIELNAVFKDMTALKALLAEKLRAAYPEAQFFEKEDILKDIGGEGQSPFTWTMESQGVTFWFSPMEIAPYADGTLKVTLLFSENEDLFADTWKEVPAGYTMMLAENQPEILDIGQDGRADTVTFSVDGAMESEEMTITVRKNDREVSYKERYYEWNGILMHTIDGRDYILVEGVGDNDLRTISVIDLNGEEPSIASTKDAAFGGRSIPGDYTYYQQIPENPENFTICERINLLSSYSGSKDAWLENGVITSDQKDYYIVDNIGMTSKEEIRGDLVDLYTGKVIAAGAVIPKGSVFTFYRTDGQSYVDFKLEDGRVIRLIATDYNKVEDRNVEELFDGVRFAG